MYIIRFTVYGVRCTVYGVRCTVYGAITIIMDRLQFGKLENNAGNNASFFVISFIILTSASPLYRSPPVYVTPFSILVSLLTPIHSLDISHRISFLLPKSLFSTRPPSDTPTLSPSFSLYILLIDTSLSTPIYPSNVYVTSPATTFHDLTPTSTPRLAIVPSDRPRSCLSRHWRRWYRKLGSSGTWWEEPRW